MKTVIKTKKAFTIISGILFAGFIANTVSQNLPVHVVEANETDNINNNAISLSTIHIPEDIIVVDKEKEPVYTPDPLKVGNIESYLNSRNSPLTEYAEEFVKAAEHYGIDYRLVASISIVESGGGINCFKPYNAWGWGKSGFKSWKDGIWAVSKGLSKYYARGLKTPKQISVYYCPPSHESWAGKVQYVMNQIGK